MLLSPETAAGLAGDWLVPGTHIQGGRVKLGSFRLLDRYPLLHKPAMLSFCSEWARDQLPVFHSKKTVVCNLAYGICLFGVHIWLTFLRSSLFSWHIWLTFLCSSMFSWWMLLSCNTSIKLSSFMCVNLERKLEVWQFSRRPSGLILLFHHLKFVPAEKSNCN